MKVANVKFKIAKSKMFLNTEVDIKSPKHALVSPNPIFLEIGSAQNKTVFFNLLLILYKRFLYFIYKFLY